MYDQSYIFPLPAVYGRNPLSVTQLSLFAAGLTCMCSACLYEPSLRAILHLTLVKSRFSSNQCFSTVLFVDTCFSKSCLLGAAEVQVQHLPGVCSCSGPGVPHPPSASLLLAAGQRCQCRQVSGPGHPHLHPALLRQKLCTAGQPI